MNFIQPQAELTSRSFKAKHQCLRAGCAPRVPAGQIQRVPYSPGLFVLLTSPSEVHCHPLSEGFTKSQYDICMPMHSLACLEVLCPLWHHPMSMKLQHISTGDTTVLTPLFLALQFTSSICYQWLKLLQWLS